ncbi:MAG: TM2 domain-containing membrane protein YozV [Bacteroidia bacterium]|jgi:TM2 domain-containing membrane protein YozV
MQPDANPDSLPALNPVFYPMSSSTTSQSPAGNATVATLLGWFLPGAGQLYLGQMALGVIAFVVVEGCFGLGYLLSDGRVWEFLDAELRSDFATLLSPEAGNLGGWLFVKKTAAYGPGFPRMHLDTVHIGSMLMAMSGVLNICFMVRAHLDARVGNRRGSVSVPPALAVGAAWFFPGLGHFLQGRKKRALMVAGLLLGLFFLGTYFAEGTNLSRERHFYYWAGQFFLGLPAMVTELVSGRPAVTGRIEFMDVGLLFASMAGLLNVLAMLDVFAWGEDQVLGNDPVEARRKQREDK